MIIINAFDRLQVCKDNMNSPASLGNAFLRLPQSCQNRPATCQSLNTDTHCNNKERSLTDHLKTANNEKILNILNMNKKNCSWQICIDNISTIFSCVVLRTIASFSSKFHAKSTSLWQWYPT